MLVIRMQRTGRKGHAQFRVVVQDSRRTPTSGRVVATLGSFNPHTKETVINKEKVEFYLKNGAQPSDRVIRILKAENIKLPSWVKASAPQNRKTRNPEKLRKNQPEQPAEVTEEPAEVEEPINEDTSETTEEKPAEQTEAAEVEGTDEKEAKKEEAPEEPKDTSEEKAETEEKVQ